MKYVAAPLDRWTKLTRLRTKIRIYKTMLCRENVRSSMPISGVTFINTAYVQEKITYAQKYDIRGLSQNYKTILWRENVRISTPTLTCRTHIMETGELAVPNGLVMNCKPAQLKVKMAAPLERKMSQTNSNYLISGCKYSFDVYTLNVYPCKV